MHAVTNPRIRIDGEKLESYIDWMYLTFVLTLTGCPAISGGRYSWAMNPEGSLWG